MKKILFIISMGVITLSCSSDQNPPISKEEMNSQDTSNKRLAVDVYPDFADLLKDLYGEDYDVGTDNTFSDDTDSFTVHEVHLKKDGSGALVGYFVKNQTTSAVVYADYQSSNGTVDIYNWHQLQGI